MNYQGIYEQARTLGAHLITICAEAKEGRDYEVPLRHAKEVLEKLNAEVVEDGELRDNLGKIQASISAEDWQSSCFRAGMLVGTIRRNHEGV